MVTEKNQTVTEMNPILFSGMYGSYFLQTLKQDTQIPMQVLFYGSF